MGIITPLVLLAIVVASLVYFFKNLKKYDWRSVLIKYLQQPNEKAKLSDQVSFAEEVVNEQPSLMGKTKTIFTKKAADQKSEKVTVSESPVSEVTTGEETMKPAASEGNGQAIPQQPQSQFEQGVSGTDSGIDEGNIVKVNSSLMQLEETYNSFNDLPEASEHAPIEGEQEYLPLEPEEHLNQETVVPGDEEVGQYCDKLSMTKKGIWYLAKTVRRKEKKQMEAISQQLLVLLDEASFNRDANVDRIFEEAFNDLKNEEYQSFFLGVQRKAMKEPDFEEEEEAEEIED